MDVGLSKVANRTYRSYSAVNPPTTLHSNGPSALVCSIQLPASSPGLRRELLSQIQLETSTTVRCETGEDTDWQTIRNRRQLAQEALIHPL